MDGLCSKERILVVGGPTATGKTALSVQLAKKHGGQVISADSMQVYKGLNVGTAKATVQEMRGIQHHLLSFLHAEETFSVAGFTQLAGEKIAQISAIGDLPILCGGTGLYISSLVNGIAFTPEKPSPEVREMFKTQWDALGAQEMHNKLSLIDPEYAQKLHANDKTRILRALELHHQTGTTMSAQLAASRKEGPQYNACVLFLNYSDRAVLYERINSRVDLMVKNGLLQEALWVFENRDLFATAAKAIGYKEFFPYFEGKETLKTCTEKLKQASRNYAKRQITWFGHMQSAHTLYVDAPDYEEQVAKIVQEFLK